MLERKPRWNVLLSAPIAIAGAGIGGLTAALAVARAGRRVLLLERAAKIEEVGAGFQIAPNAGRVLGRHWFLLVFTLDLAKGLGPVLLANWAVDTNQADSWLKISTAAAAILVDADTGRVTTVEDFNRAGEQAFERVFRRSAAGGHSGSSMPLVMRK